MESRSFEHLTGPLHCAKACPRPRHVLLLAFAPPAFRATKGSAALLQFSLKKCVPLLCGMCAHLLLSIVLLFFLVLLVLLVFVLYTLLSVISLMYEYVCACSLRSTCSERPAVEVFLTVFLRAHRFLSSSAWFLCMCVFVCS